MKISSVTYICAVIVGLSALSVPASAQEKTVKACEQEWQANKAANQAKGITEKAYVAKCRGEDTAEKKKEPAAKTTAKDDKAKPAATGEKTVKACEDEWRANKAANQAKGITEKAYVAKCRGGDTAEKPAAPVTPAAAKKEEKEKPSTASQPAPATGKPTGANQYAAESQAKSHCPSATVVWANLDSKIYHFAGHEDYGHTKKGAYMCEKDALSQGIRAAKNEKHP